MWVLRRLRFQKAWLFTALLASLASFPISAKATDSTRPIADYSDPRNLPDEEIGIVNLSDQEVTPELRKCLQHRLLGDCLKEDLGGKTLKKQTPPQNLGNEIDDDMIGAWKSFLFSAITPNQSLYSTHGAGFYYGIQIGGTRIDMDEVAMDPNKLATEQKLGTDDVWVKHDFEILPQAGFGYGHLSPGSSGPPKAQYVNALVTLNNVMRITKRHPMDQVYNDSFWGYGRQDLKIIGQVFPLYLSISTKLDGQGMLPGEGIEFERYGAIGLGIGPTLSLLATPVTVTTLQAGIFGSAGLVINLVRGHFRTVMEVQQDGTLHLALEHIKQDSESLQAELEAGLSLGPISYVLNLLRIETGVTHTSETVLDMVLDPKYPAARKALYHAYLGFFGTAQDLAAQAGTNYQGVRAIDHAYMNETMHDRGFESFFYNRGSSLAEDTVTSAPSNAQADAHADAHADVTTIDSMDQHRSTLRSNKDLQIFINTDDKNPNPMTDRSLSVKFRFSSNNAKPDELRQFLDLGRIFAPAEKQAEIADWMNTLQTEHPGKKRGKLQGYFYVTFDPSILADLLQVPDTDKPSDLLENWAAALGLADPQSWGSMSEQEQDAAAKKVPGLKDHLKVFRQFCKAVEKTLQKNTPLEQAKAFVQALRGKSYDLYPIASLSIPSDHTHMLALERITLGNGQDSKSLEFSSIGSNYVFPKKTLY